MKRAIFWVAWGEQYVDEAHASAMTVKRHMPDIDRVLWTGKGVVGGLRGGNKSLFNRVLGNTAKHIKHAHKMLHGLNFRVDAIHRLMDYDQLLFLDSETHLCAPVYELFGMLERFDFVTALSTGRCARRGGPKIPDGPFPERNSGVVAFRNDDRIRAFHDTWLELYKKHQRAFKNSNQRSLREAIWEDKTGLQFGTIPAEWNCRFVFGFWARLQVKVLHGRPTSLSYKKIDRIINKRLPMMRAWPRRAF